MRINIITKSLFIFLLPGTISNYGQLIANHYSGFHIELSHLQPGSRIATLEEYPTYPTDSTDLEEIRSQLNSISIKDMYHLTHEFDSAGNITKSVAMNIAGDTLSYTHIKYNEKHKLIEYKQVYSDTFNYNQFYMIEYLKDSSIYRKIDLAYERADTIFYKKHWNKKAEITDLYSKGHYFKGKNRQHIQYKNENISKNNYISHSTNSSYKFSQVSFYNRHGKHKLTKSKSSNSYYYGSSYVTTKSLTNNTEISIIKNKCSVDTTIRTLNDFEDVISIDKTAWHCDYRLCSKKYEEKIKGLSEDELKEMKTWIKFTNHNTYQYVYDSHNNWIKKSEFTDGVLTRVTERKITYSIN